VVQFEARASAATAAIVEGRASAAAAAAAAAIVYARLQTAACRVSEFIGTMQSQIEYEILKPVLRPSVREYTLPSLACKNK